MRGIFFALIVAVAALLAPVRTANLVMAEGEAGALMVSGCNPSRPSSQAGEELAALATLSARR